MAIGSNITDRLLRSQRWAGPDQLMGGVLDIVSAAKIDAARRKARRQGAAMDEFVGPLTSEQEKRRSILDEIAYPGRSIGPATEAYASTSGRMQMGLELAKEKERKAAEEKAQEFEQKRILQKELGQSWLDRVTRAGELKNLGLQDTLEARLREAEMRGDWMKYNAELLAGSRERVATIGAKSREAAAMIRERIDPTESEAGRFFWDQIEAGKSKTQAYEATMQKYAGVLSDSASENLRKVTMYSGQEPDTMKRIERFVKMADTMMGPETYADKTEKGAADRAKRLQETVATLMERYHDREAFELYVGRNAEFSGRSGKGSTAAGQEPPPLIPWGLPEAPETPSLFETSRRTAPATIPHYQPETPSLFETSRRTAPATIPHYQPETPPLLPTARETPPARSGATNAAPTGEWMEINPGVRVRVIKK